MKGDIIKMINLWLVLNVPLGQRWDDNWVHCLASEMTKLPLYHFPRDCWRLSALQVSTLTSKQPLILWAHRELLHGHLLILCQVDKSEWEGFQSLGSFHRLFDNTLSGKFVRTTRLSVTSAISHGNFVCFSGVLNCYCFITPSRGGEDFESMPQGVFSNRILSPQKSTWRLWLHCSDLVLKSIS